MIHTIKLYSYDDILIRGTLSNADVKIVTSPLDLTTLDMSGDRFVIYEETNPSRYTTQVNAYAHNHYRLTHWHDLFGVSSSPNVIVAQDSDLSGIYDGHWICRGKHATCHDRGVIDGHHTYHSKYQNHHIDRNNPSTLDVSTVYEGKKITKQTTTGIRYFSGVSQTHTIYSESPWNLQHHLTADFELVTPLSTNSYLVVTLNDGGATIKGESFYTDSDVFFKVDGLPADTAFDVSKNGITGVVGKTESNGVITLLYDDVSFGIPTSPGGILRIYPDSTKYLGNLGAALIDMYHKESIPLNTGEDLVYIPQNFVRWIFPVPVEVADVRIDEISLDYLNGDYAKNDALVIPVIPNADIIYATINGTDTEVLMRDVSVYTQIKQVLKKSSTSSDHSTTGAVSTSSNISTSTFLTATHTGTAIANINIKVGGSADFSMSSSYTGEFVESRSCKWSGASSPYRTYSCSAHSNPVNPSDITNIQSLTSAHRDQIVAALDNGQLSQITVDVDIIKNMEYVKTVTIYSSNPTTATVSSTLSNARYGASNQVHIVYPLTLVSEYITTQVDVGDMIEYVIRVNLDVAGAPVPTSNDGSYSSYVSATTEFDGGVIIVSMS